MFRASPGRIAPGAAQRFGKVAATPPSPESPVTGVPGKPCRRLLLAAGLAVVAVLIAIASTAYLRLSQPTEEVVGPAILVLPLTRSAMIRRITTSPPASPMK